MYKAACYVLRVGHMTQKEIRHSFYLESVHSQVNMGIVLAECKSPPSKGVVNSSLRLGKVNIGRVLFGEGGPEEGLDG